MKKKNEILSKENEILKRNISCIFRTAQLEIARKDKQIKELRESLEKLQVRRGI